MLKKTTIILVLSFVWILWATPMVFGQKYQAEQIPLDQRGGPTPPAISPEEGWYWKPDYEDYAPSGMPDIDQKQDNWKKEDTDQWTLCCCQLFQVVRF